LRTARPSLLHHQADARADGARQRSLNGLSRCRPVSSTEATLGRMPGILSTWSRLLLSGLLFNLRLLFRSQPLRLQAAAERQAASEKAAAERQAARREMDQGGVPCDRLQMASPPAPECQGVHCRHLERLAIVYVRQSSLHQVIEHPESRARQYALADHAVTLGWPKERVVVIDEDQGPAQQRRCVPWACIFSPGALSHWILPLHGPHAKGTMSNTSAPDAMNLIRWLAEAVGWNIAVWTHGGSRKEPGRNQERAMSALFVALTGRKPTAEELHEMGSTDVFWVL
jgi:hypothetical protein